MTSDQANGLRVVDTPDRDRSVGRSGVSRVPPEILRFAGLAPEKRDLLMHVHDLLDDIPFGTVVLVVQDGKVIQIETSEKIRLR